MQEGVWGWYPTDKKWVKLRVDEDGKLIVSDADPFEITQDTPTDLKHLPHGRVTGDGVYVPFAVNADHKLQVEVEIYNHHALHEDGGDDEISIANLAGIPTELPIHTADPDAHHSEEVAEGRGYYNTTTLLSLPGARGVSDSTKAINANKVFYAPIIVTTPIVIDQVVLEVTVAAGAGEKARVGIYAADINWQPGALQVASAEIAIDAIAVVTTDITETTLQEGRYLIALTVEGNATFTTMKTTLDVIGYKTTLGGTPCRDSVYVNKAYAALADPGTAWDSVTSSSNPAWHAVWLRIKTP